MKIATKKKKKKLCFNLNYFAWAANVGEILVAGKIKPHWQNYIGGSPLGPEKKRKQNIQKPAGFASAGQIGRLYTGGLEISSLKGHNKQPGTTSYKLHFSTV